MAPKRKKYSIDSVEITPDDNASVKRVMDRLMGRATVKPEDTPPTPSARSSLSAQTTQSTPTAQSRTTTEGSQSAQSTTAAQSKHPAQGKTSAQSSQSAQGRKTAQGRLAAQAEIAPSRDFMRTANSIVRDALRAGLFKGKSKQLYDYLYAKTRGAITPRVSVQLRRGEIMKGAHIGSTHTLRDNLLHLRAVGLVRWTEKAGEQEGNVYSVYLPEEVHLPFDLDGNPVQSDSAGQAHSTGHVEQKLPRPPSAETTQSGQGTSQRERESSGNPKTSFKTNTEKLDDEAAPPSVVRALKSLIEEVTGRKATTTEFERLVELIEVLKVEGKIAALRSDSVSSAGPFLAEHLRRRLFKKNREEMTRETSPPATVTIEPAIDVRQCTECGGTGWYYPEGEERAVARCRHEKLRQAKEPDAGQETQ